MSVELNPDVFRCIMSSFSPRELYPVSQVCKAWNHCLAIWMEALHNDSMYRVKEGKYTLTSWIALNDVMRMPTMELQHPRDFWVKYLGDPIGDDPVLEQIPRLCQPDIDYPRLANCVMYPAVYIYSAVKRRICEQQMAIVDELGRLRIQPTWPLDADVINMWAAANNCTVAIGPSEIEVGTSIHNILELFRCPDDSKRSVFNIVPNVADLIYDQCFALQSVPSVVFVRRNVSQASLNKTWNQVNLLPNIQIAGSLPVILLWGFMSLDCRIIPNKSKFVRTTDTLQKDGQSFRLTIGGYTSHTGWSILLDELLADANLQLGAAFCIRDEDQL